MPPKSKIAGIASPVQLQWKLTVTGGRLRQPQLIEVVSKQWCEQAKTMTVVSDKTPWLCEMATGEYVCKRPLKRCRIFDQWQALMADAGTPSDEGRAADPWQG